MSKTKKHFSEKDEVRMLLDKYFDNYIVIGQSEDEEPIYVEVKTLGSGYGFWPAATRELDRLHNLYPNIFPYNNFRSCKKASY